MKHALKYTWRTWCCICTYVVMYARTYVRMYVWMYVWMCVCVYVCMCVCVYVCMYVCTYVCMYVCMCVCMYVRTYVRTYVCMYVFMYEWCHYSIKCLKNISKWRWQLGVRWGQGFANSSLVKIGSHGCQPRVQNHRVDTGAPCLVWYNRIQ